MIRVVVIDGQALTRLGVRMLLSAEPDVEIVGECDGEYGVDVVRATVPDVVLMDIRMPGRDGMSTLRAITTDPALTRVKVIVLTSSGMDEHVFEALRCGAGGFLLKDAEPEELLRAIRVVVTGGALLSPSITSKVIARFADGCALSAPHPGVKLLTEREREVVGYVATGMSNDEIAARLVLSPETVRTHVSRAMVKLHARDRAQLVVFALRSSLTSSS